MMMLANAMHPYPLFLRYTVLSKCTSKATFIQRDCCHVGLLLWRSLTLFLRRTDVASPQGGALSLSSSNLSQAAGFLPPHHKDKAAAHSFGVVVGVLNQQLP